MIAIKRNIKLKLLPLVTILSFFLLTLSSFNKIYIPVITKNTKSGVMKSCPEHIRQNKISELIDEVIGKSDKTDNPEKLCFCQHTNLRKNIKYFLDGVITNLTFQYRTDFKYSGVKELPYKFGLAENNKAPPTSFVY